MFIVWPPKPTHKSKLRWWILLQSICKVEAPIVDKVHLTCSLGLCNADKDDIYIFLGKQSLCSCGGGLWLITLKRVLTLVAAIYHGPLTHCATFSPSVGHGPHPTLMVVRAATPYSRWQTGGPTPSTIVHALAHTNRWGYTWFVC
jgi:hypothetical protein